MVKLERNFGKVPVFYFQVFYHLEAIFLTIGRVLQFFPLIELQTEKFYTWLNLLQTGYY